MSEHEVSTEKTPSLQATLAYGNALEMAKQYDAARNEYRAQLAATLTAAPAAALHAGIARCAGASADPSAARTAFEAALALEPERREWRLGLAQTLLSLGDVAAAQTLFGGLLAGGEDAEPLAGLGQCARQSGDKAAALAHFSAAARLRPDVPAYLLELAEAQRRQNLLEEAEASYRMLLARAPHLAAAHAGLGHVLRRQGRRQNAALSFTQAAELQPNDFGLRLAAALERRVTGDFALAREMAQAVLAARPNFLPAIINLAETERAAGQAEAAWKILAEALQRSPSEPLLLLQAAHCLRIMQRYGQAEAMYRRTLTEQPRNGWAYVGLAQCARAQGQVEPARDCLERALALAPQEPALQRDIAAEQRRLDALVEKRAAAAPAVPASPTAPAIAPQPELSTTPAARQRALELQAETERAAGRPAAALAVLEEVLPDANAHPQLQLQAAHSLRALRRFDDAKMMYRRVIALQPQNGWAYVGLGQSAKQQGAFEEAAECFARALALAPSDSAMHLDLAAEQREMGHFEAARTLARPFLSHEKLRLRALISLAETERAADRPAVALGLFEQALPEAPRDPQLLIKTAHCLRSLQRLADAKLMYRRVIDEQPDNGWAYVGLGQTAKRQGEIAEAEDCFAQALTLLPDDPGLRLDIASEQRDMGRFDKARALAETLLTDGPEHFRALINLAETERVAREFEAALGWLGQAHAIRPRDCETLVRMATAARLLGRQAECDGYLHAALAIDPHAVSATRSLAEQYLRAEDPQAALDLLQTAASQNPGETAFQFTLLDAMIAAGRPHDALALMDELEQKIGPHHTILTKRAHTLRRIGQYYEAAAAARQAAKLYPYNISAWHECLQAEALIGDDDSIANLLDAAPAVTPEENAIATHGRGAFAERQWRFADAATHYRAVLALTPQNVEVVFNSARVSLVTLNLAAARAQLEQHRDLEAPNLRLRGKSLNTSQTLYGQLLDEYALNDTPPRIRALLDLPPATRTAALLPTVQAEPDNTAAAMSLLIALRLSGGFPAINHPGGAPIPKMIFQFWDTATVPEDIATYRATWRAQNPDYAVHVFDNAAALRFLRGTFPPPVAHAYQNALEPAQKADIFRLAALFAYGGVYADADDRCQRPLQTMLPAGAALVLYQEDLGTLGNNFIATCPRHPLILKALQLSIQAINRGDADIAWLSTGPGMLTRAFAQNFCRGAQGLPGQTLVLSTPELCRTVAIHCHCAYKTTRKHWTNSSFARKRDAKRPAG